MFASAQPTNAPRVAWVIAKLTAGGIGPVCRYAAEGVAVHLGWPATMVCLHEAFDEFIDPATGVRFVGLGLGLEGTAASGFLQWLEANPQDIVITSDVTYLESAFPYFPREVLHVIQIHDSLPRYREVAARHHRWVDGVFCVGRHIEAPLRSRLESLGFKGLLTTVHNGAAFLPLLPRIPAKANAPMRLLFMGRMDPFKGISDLVPILKYLKRMRVPVELLIVGGEHEGLRRRFKRANLDHLVKWVGRVPHQECYRLASESDLFLMLSRREPFGMVTIEAMSMGCVPLGYDVPSGTSEIIEHGRSGLLLPLGDYSACARAIASLHANREEWQRLSAGAVERARTHFNEKVMGIALGKFLNQVQAHAQKTPAERKTGFLPEAAPGKCDKGMGLGLYHRLSPVLRDWVRNQICAYPRLTYWLLNR